MSPDDDVKRRSAKASMMHTGKTRLIIFVTDAGFFVPTVRAALGAMRQAAVQAVADCLIFVVDGQSDYLHALNEAFESYHICFLGLEPASFLPKALQIFHGGHVPTATLGRLALAPLIPERYTHIVYLDGDIEIAGDIAPLIRHDVAPGKIAAAPESLWLYEGNGWRRWRKFERYLKGLGISDPKTYFNAGVLSCRRETWVDMTRQASEFFAENSAKCIFHDQSALNAVNAGRREILSPWFNFLSEYAALGFHNRDEIRIVHFNGPNKPWEYVGAPWHGKYFHSYPDLVASWPILRPTWVPRSPQQSNGLSLQTAKRLLRWADSAPWRSPLRRKLFSDFVASSKFVP